EYQLTKSMLENLEGFPEAVQFLSKSPDFQDKNILLADIFTCEESYKAPLEAFLDNLLNFYVLESLEQAIKAVDLLYTAQKGKANFFILENIKPTTQVLAIPDTQKATSLIICEEKYKKLFEYLLENVFICGEQDLPELQKKHLDCTFISKNAKIISRSASISGGSVSSYEGKHIGRKQQLEVLEQEIQTLSEEISELKENIAEKQAEIQELKNNSLAEEIRETQVLYHKKNEQFITLRTKTEQIQNLIEHSEEKNETLLNRLEQLASETEDLQPQINDLEKLVKELQEKLNNHSDLLAKANDLLSQKSGVFNQENLKYHQQENRVKSIEQELKFNESSLEALRNRLSKNNDEILRITNEIDILENTAETFDDKLFEMYQEKESMEKGLNEAEKDYYAQRGEIERNEKEIRELQRKKENIDIIINEIQNKINETKLSFASTKERLSVEFNVDLEALMSEENTLVSEKTEEELKTEVQRLKNVLDTIGAINPMAMEAYQEIKERNDFIIAQKDDLLKAKNALLETIEEIDTVAKENFLTTFEAIRTNFQKVFRSLFTEEDTCDLILLKPENPLESPIDIVAKPKGKRPLTINQLSGGEKTLTATSLLFAIYLIKPAPFCIFDEVDAPLDDANVDKFTKIIRKFSEQSQFIIVTHNKRTMAATDIMYGVTMYPEDPGVSKLVPVDLRNLQEEFVSN
ncbi:MAG: chromosome segregation protein SMC, partial [Thermonemataceae bacterium]|nr:chromosome segregation protein SMC [Thermonemataceae bacterium]